MVTSLTKQVVAGQQTPYQINPDQIVRASQSLSKHIAATRIQGQKESGKRDLLQDDDSADEDDGVSDNEAQPVEEDGALWLVVSTKKFIADKTRLKPYKIAVPHTLNQTSHTSICLITADPQRRYKDIIADESFPSSLRPFVSRVIGISKLKAKFKSFESRRQLAGEHTHFFADERIVTALPHLLGKSFYKSTGKRPVPIKLTGHAGRRVNKDLANKAKKERYAAGNKESALFGTPAEIGHEITRALSSALVNLSASTSTSVRIGFANWNPEHIRDNVQAVVKGMLEPGDNGEVRIVPGGWRNVRSIHLKGAKTTALPLWLADELWAEEQDVVEYTKPVVDAVKEGGDKTSSESTKCKKRKSLDNADQTALSSTSTKKSKLATAEQENQSQSSKKPTKSPAVTTKAALEKDVAARKDKMKAERGKAMSQLLK